MSLEQSIKNLADKLRNKYFQALLNGNIVEIVSAFREVNFPTNLVSHKQHEELIKQLIKELDLSNLILSDRNIYTTFTAEYCVKDLLQAYQFYKLNSSPSEIVKITSQLEVGLDTDTLHSESNFKVLNFISAQISTSYATKVSDLSKHIAAIKDTDYDRDNLKDKKIRALCDLNNMLMQRYGKQSPKDIINEWKNKKSDGVSTNYSLISEHRNIKGLYKFYALIANTKTQNFIDDLEKSFTSNNSVPGM